MSQKQFGKYQKNMQNKALERYRVRLKEKTAGLFFKRCFDIFASLFCLIVTLPFSLAAAVAIKINSPGPVFYRQLRVGINASKLYVLKFRSMRVDADKTGELTVGSGDKRVTGIGKLLRRTNFDEFPQFLLVLAGKMSIIGIRPEVPRYVDCYTPEDYATLLMKPGMTSPVAIKYRHENDILASRSDPEKAYIEEILPAKMKINRDYVLQFSFLNDMRILGRTFRCLFEKDEAVQ